MKMNLVLFLLCIPIAVTAEKTIFVIESYHAEYEWDASYTKALETSLAPRYRLEYFQMDTKRLPKEKHQAMADRAWEIYQALKPDLVILGDDAAMKFLAGKFSKTATPVVYLGINSNPRLYLPDSAENFTGVLERPLIKRSILYIQSLIPKAKKILLLFDSDITSQIIKSEYFGDRDRIVITGIDIEIKFLRTLKEWKETIPAMKGTYDACVVGLYQSVRDSEGKPVDADELIRWVSKNTPIPAFAFWDFAVGKDKTIGGLVLYGKEMGRLASGLVSKILDEGIPPKAITVIFNDQGQFLFSAAQVKKWGITIPEGILSSATRIE